MPKPPTEYQLRAHLPYRGSEKRKQQTLTRGRRWYEEHKKRHLANGQRWREEHRAHSNEIAHRRRAALRGVFVETVDPDVIFERDKGVCQLCHKVVKRAAMSLDHIIPIAEGGTHESKNVQLAHLRCNFRKGRWAHIPSQIRMLP